MLFLNSLCSVYFARALRQLKKTAGEVVSNHLSELINSIDSFIVIYSEFMRSDKITEFSEDIPQYHSVLVNISNRMNQIKQVILNIADLKSYDEIRIMSVEIVQQINNIQEDAELLKNAEYDEEDSQRYSDIFMFNDSNLFDHCMELVANIPRLLQIKINEVAMLEKLPTTVNFIPPERIAVPPTSIEEESELSQEVANEFEGSDHDETGLNNESDKHMKAQKSVNYLSQRIKDCKKEYHLKMQMDPKYRKEKIDNVYQWRVDKKEEYEQTRKEHQKNYNNRLKAAYLDLAKFKKSFEKLTELSKDPKELASFKETSPEAYQKILSDVVKYKRIKEQVDILNKLINNKEELKSSYVKYIELKKNDKMLDNFRKEHSQEYASLFKDYLQYNTLQTKINELLSKEELETVNKAKQLEKAKKSRVMSNKKRRDDEKLKYLEYLNGGNKDI